MSPIELRPYDTAEFLRDEQECLGLLDAALEGGEPRVIASVLGAIARWQGMTEVTEKIGLDPDCLSRTLSVHGDPTLDILMQVVKALGIQLRCEALQPQAEANSRSRMEEDMRCGNRKEESA